MRSARRRMTRPPHLEQRRPIPSGGSGSRAVHAEDGVTAQSLALVVSLALLFGAAVPLTI